MTNINSMPNNIFCTRVREDVKKVQEAGLSTKAIREKVYELVKKNMNVMISGVSKDGSIKAKIEVDNEQINKELYKYISETQEGWNK